MARRMKTWSSASTARMRTSWKRRWSWTRTRRRRRKAILTMLKRTFYTIWR
jgi:hypothetical protein